MSLRIYNTMTGEKEEFVPLRGKKVGMYVCGVTVYDLCHIGHARAGVIFDAIYRFLRYRGYDVTYVRNFTDIDDKIIKRANEEGGDYRTIAERYIKEFYADMGMFNLEKPQIEPRATEHISEMIRLVSTLIEKGYAYPSGGDVFFSVERFAGYGKLSKRNLEEMQAGARIEVDEKKENPLDFALWKASKPGEPFWESPWGKGRPGWHIECSVMSQKYLGETLDIHGGGKDLIFPHHENEIAQSEAATGQPFVHYWVHNGFVNINKEKMSKSLGNILTLKEIFREWHPEVVRLFLLSHHYRSPVDFSFESLSEAKAGLDRFYTTLKTIREKLQSAPSPAGEGNAKTPNLQESHQALDSFKERFEEAMDDDFNTAEALGYFYELQRYVNSLLDSLRGCPEKEVASLLKTGLDRFTQLGWVLGLFQEDPGRYLEEVKKAGLKKLNLAEEQVLQLIEERNKARKEKNWKKADEIRNDLLSRGIILEDTSSGTHWKIR
ncbi:MAG: cysteine--tRNA ligase [Deltaproteobacteria bacterium RBG_13_52_11b]|nr:MAG: cysteine--tRNA ligase [Deltaproteobacteria bacterium RBG_13_52_11b]